MKPIAIVIHHTVTDQNITPEALRAIFKSRFNVDYIGYNFYIRGNGEVHSDLGAEKVGIHNNVGKFNNTNSVGISLAGNFEEQEPTREQLNSLSDLIFELQRNYHIPDENIVGHRDMKSTACPGKNLYKYKPWKEAKVDEKEVAKKVFCHTLNGYFNSIYGRSFPDPVKQFENDFNFWWASKGVECAGQWVNQQPNEQEFKDKWVKKEQCATEVAKAKDDETKRYETLIKEFEKKIVGLERDIEEQAGLCEGKIEKAVKQAQKDCKNKQVILYESAIINCLKKVWWKIWTK